MYVINALLKGEEMDKLSKKHERSTPRAVSTSVLESCFSRKE
jgi:hypothetical protein